MRPLPTRRVWLLGALLALLVLALGAAPAYPAARHTASVVVFADFLGIGHLVGSVFGSIGHAVIGAFSWTISLASKFILVTLGALVRMLIPRSWAREAIQVFEWIVAIPDYAGTVTSPGGGHSYGFAGVNDLRELFQWLGIGLLPLTLVYATSRAMLGRGDHLAAPLARVVILAGLLASYPYWWQQGAALTNQLTSLILSPAAVTTGIQKLMAYATEGVALGGWQLIDLGLMAALALELLALIFAKVILILIGALLFATGPLMIGLVATESGDSLARAWLSAVATLLMLPVAWAAVFAVGAVLVNDASSAGPLIGGSSQIGSLLGGVIVAVAGAATLWLCLRGAREVGGLLRLQLGGLLVIAGRARSRAGSPPAAAAGTSTRAAAAAGSIRSFQGKVRAAAGAAVDAAGPKTAAVAGAAGVAGRRGLVISSAGAAGSAARLAARSPAGTAARTQLAAAAATAGARTGRAGAVASRMARAGTAAWQQHDAASTPASSVPAAGGQTARQTGGSGEDTRPSRPAAGRQPAGVSSAPAAAPTPARSGAVPKPSSTGLPARAGAAPVRSASTSTGAPTHPASHKSPDSHQSPQNQDPRAPAHSAPAPSPRTRPPRASEPRTPQPPTPPALTDRGPKASPPAPARPQPQPRPTRTERPNAREE